MKGSISEEALNQYNRLVAEKQGLDFAEGDIYDFTTCIRSDGSAYGTGGTCRKGTEGEAKKESAAEAKPKRQLATSADAKSAWQESEKAVKAAKANLKTVGAETKGDQSPGARERRRKAAEALEKEELKALKASDKFFAARKREERSTMTPAQRKLEREADQLTKGG